ncbi:MAG: methyltransferase domain-containing protein [Acidimicrobiia bacterium]|nr:methyltransferase domain-containing protein [Acidimicrobiia bacterium]
MSELPEYVQVNRDHWDNNAHEWVAMGERAWASPDPTWGMWGIPEADLKLLPEDMAGMRAIELGCGTGYIAAWIARRGASVVAVDNSAKQLETAVRLNEQYGLDIEFVHGIAESVDAPDGSFDFAVSEYGAALWSDPSVWIPEAHRLLKSGSQLVFLSSTTLSAICSPLDGSLPTSETLQRAYFGVHTFDWRDAIDDPGGIEFHLTTSDWVHLFNDTGFEILDFHELQAPREGDEVNFFATATWSRKWPSEQVWVLRKR